MSLQVGLACYATPAQAGGAACSNFTPVTTLVADGTILRTVSCGSADPDSGALNLTVTSSPVAGGSSSAVVVQQVLEYPDCQYAAYADAWKVVFGAVLGLVVMVYVWRDFLGFLRWGRGDTL